MNKVAFLAFSTGLLAHASAVTVVTHTYDALASGSAYNSPEYAYQYSYSEGGAGATNGTANAAIATISGADKGLVLTADYSGIPAASPSPSRYNYWGAEAVYNGNGVAGSGASLADFTYTFTVTNSDNNTGMNLRFFSFGANNTSETGAREILITYTGNGTPQTFTGSLADAGWTTQGYLAGGTDIKLSSPSYGVKWQQIGSLGWGKDAGNAMSVSEVSLNVVPEPSAWAVLMGCAIGLASRRRRS